MTVDIHTHFWKPEHIGERSYEYAASAGGVMPRFSFTAEDHLLETAAVDKAVVFGFRSANITVPNDIVREHCDRAPDRLVFFTSVCPAEDGFMRELERTHGELGAKGVKLGPVYQGVHPTDRRYGEIYGYCEKHGLPIVSHMATTFDRDFPLEYARPIYADDIAREFPKLRLVLAHLGHPWIGETAAVIRRHPHIYADISALYYRPWQFFSAMRTVFEYGAWRKVLFGSDFPFTSPANSIEGLKNINAVVAGSAVPPVPDEVIDGILNRNTLAELEIE